MSSSERRSLPLAPSDWQNLERLASELSSTARYGPNAGNPSWRTLIKDIARGEVILSRPTTPSTYNLEQAAAYLDMSTAGLRYYLRGNELTPDQRDGNAQLFYQQTLDHFQANVRRQRT